MRKIVLVLSLLLVLLLSFSANSAFAIPTQDPDHPHAIPANVHWWADKNNNGAFDPGADPHNHRDECNFWDLSDTGRYTDPDPDRASTQPYEHSAVWDCRTFSYDDDADCDMGHGFINEYPALGGGPDHIPRYCFDAGDPWPAEVPGGLDPRNRIRNAFSQWSAIASDKVNHVVGLEFREVSSGAAEIMVNWYADAEVIAGSTWDGSFGLVDRAARPVQVYFEIEPGQTGVNEAAWWYGAAAATPVDNPATPANEGQYHFLTVALHEIGHVVGLDDQDDNDDVMFGDGFATGPAGPSFDALPPYIIPGAPPDDIHGALDLYMIELTHEHAALLKAATTDAAPRVAPVNTPATITITNAGPVPIEVYGWEVTRPDSVVDAVVFAPRVVLPGATVVVTVYRGCADPGVYRYRVFWDPVSEGTFERYSRAVGGTIVLIDRAPPVDKFGLLAPSIGLASTILIATVATAIYVRHVKRRKKKQ